MSDDYNINNDDDELKKDLPAIDGQIGMEELLIREDEPVEETNSYIPPIDNQISLDDFVIGNEVLKNKDELLNGDPLGIFNNERTEKLDDFFKTENDNEENPPQNKVANINETYNTDEQGNEDKDDFESPQNISKTLDNFYNKQEDDILKDDGEDSDEDVSINDLIGSEFKAEDNDNQAYNNQQRNNQFVENGAFSGLNNNGTSSNDIKSDIVGGTNDTEKEEGLSILEDNNNNNFNNENMQNNGNNYNQNYNNENGRNTNNFGEDNSVQNEYNNYQNYNQENGNQDDSVYNNYQNNVDNGDNNDGDLSNNFFADSSYGGNASNEDTAFNVNSEEQNYYENTNSSNETSVDNLNNEAIDNSYNNGYENNNFNNDENTSGDNNNNADNFDGSDALNNYENNVEDTNSSNDDNIFNETSNDEVNNTEQENYSEVNNNNYNNDSDNNNNNYNDNIGNYNDDSSNYNDNNNDENDINKFANTDDNTDNANGDADANQYDSIENNDSVNEEEQFINEQEETLQEDENKIEDKQESVNKSAKIVAKQVRAKQPSKENYFENDENSKIIEDVENINKDYEDVDVIVGKDAFADYADENLVTGKIEETEVEEIKEKVYSDNSGQDVVDGMLYKNLDTVLHESMIPYSEHVILDRALPRVEDGLKPVQRRILYSMLELGVTPDKPYRKSARIVGDCLGKYHPHGDTSVYDAMVRMAQPFNTNMLLVSGHGNFGSVDGDGAAAMRYTEARLAPISMELLRDLDKNTVKWGLNFDDTLKEPEILPGRFPNLLVNGATGIAVGLATNIPPHNLAETIDGVVAYLNNPSIKLKEMLKIIKGPDFPTGAYILNSSELYQAYETGRGKIYLRAKMHIESNGTDKRYIVITELPYQVNKSSLLQKIAMYKDEDRYGLGGISEVRDESDREGLRAVLRLKKDADIKAIYKSLLKNTELQTTFGINMVAIANGKPKQMSLLDIISYYAEYQREIIYRRSKFELEQAKEREHILTGLIIAIKNIDAVVKIIKTSQNTTEAKKRLKEKFNLSDRQAQAILDMRLAKLTSLEVYKLEEELKRLRELIKKLTAILASKKLQRDIVKEEMLQIKRQYKQDRKTKFAKMEEDLGAAPQPKEEANQKVIILKSAENNFKCVNIKQYNYAQKEVTDNSSLLDTHILKFETETNKTLIAFSSLGNCFKVDVKDFTQSRYRDKGVPEQSIFKELNNKETIVALFDISITSKQGNFIFLTKYGMIKKTAYTEYSLLKKYYQGMKLKDDDEILMVVEEPKDYTYIFVTKQGMVLNAENSDVPLQGRVSGGVKGINLATNDYCVGVGLAQDGGEILAITNKGFTKRVLVANVDKSARYRKGLKFFTFTGDNGRELIYASVVTNPFVLGCVDNENNFHYRSTDHIPIENRTGKGKAVDRLKKSLTILKAFRINN